jgi:uncharacterized RDD family membrane protein YckC
MGKPRLAQPLDTTTEVETPEHVRFRYHVAGPARRLFAYGIDLVIRALILLAFVIVAGIGGFMSGMPDASTGVILVVWFALEWFYYVFFEALWSGRTPGKRALSLRVLSDTGHPLRLGQSFLRNLLRAVDLFPTFQPFPSSLPGLDLPTYGVGTASMARDGRFRRLGDLVAGTMVVVEERAFVEGALVIHPPPSARELASLPQRLPLSGEELDAVEVFLRREHRLPPARAHELAEMIAPTFGGRIGIGSIRDPVRFLKILYARARGIPAAPEAPQRQGPPPGQNPYQQGQQQQAPFGAPGWQPPQQHGHWGPR